LDEQCADNNKPNVYMHWHVCVLQGVDVTITMGWLKKINPDGEWSEGEYDTDDEWDNDDDR